ncbi:annexin D5 isoform X2 [Beta vulgaris subsp. vulgaris]|uniref:annexin D5 isoform X2 n=1 Tax=Beta vulgaris subsp. vulgaris TaxID=3555 RepID=UPI0020369785|nr:annexin D5 isoform X2 [Beta vulgaris subsp. vulgaris]
MSTLSIPPTLFSPVDDVSLLHKAFRGLGCDYSMVINILAHRDASQRMSIQQEFTHWYSGDIRTCLTEKLTGNLKIAVLLWILEPATRDAVVLNQALLKDDMRGATEVICSRTPTQIQTFKQIYNSMFGLLEHDLQKHTSGDHKKLLVAYISIQRDEGSEFDIMAAENDAKTLYLAVEKRSGTDKIIKIFSESSNAHLVSVDSIYNRMYGHSLEKVLRKAMKGLRTGDKTLIRVIVTRVEIDMQYIKAEYQKEYKNSLVTAVRLRTVGNYRKFLLALLGTKH